MTYVGGVDGKVIDEMSTSTALGADETWTSDAFDLSSYGSFSVFFDTDQDGTAYIDFSTDGTNFDRSKPIIVDQDIGSGSTHTLAAASPYVRLRFVNGSVAQSYLRLSFSAHNSAVRMLSSSGSEIISRVNDVSLVRVTNSPLLDVSRGLYGDAFNKHKFGYNGSCPNGTERDIWTYGATGLGNIDYNWMTTAATLRVQAGGNANDTAAGTGARSVTLEYLDSNYDVQTETLATAGASASSATSTTAIRLLRAWVATSGTYTGANTGNIIIEETGGSAVVGHILAGIGQTEMTMYTVPAGYTAYLLSINGRVQVGTSKDALVAMYQRQDSDTVSAPYGSKRVVWRAYGIQGEFHVDFDSYPNFPEKTDLWISGYGNGAVTAISVTYDLVLINNETAAPQ